MSKPESMKLSKKRSTEPQECLKHFHVVLAWIQSLTWRVVGQPEVAEGGVGAEGGGLRAEVRAAEEDGVDAVADAGVDALEVLDADLALAREDGLDEVLAAAGGHVPFGDVADALGVLHEGAGDEGDVAEGGAAEGGEDAVSGGVGGVDLAREVLEVGVADGGELLEVVFDGGVVVVEGLLADDGVEEVAAGGHAAGGRDEAIAFGVDEDVAVGVDVDGRSPGRRGRRGR